MKRRRKVDDDREAKTTEVSRKKPTSLPFVIFTSLIIIFATSEFQITPPVRALESGLRFDAETNSYSGLTFTFDPRLDKRVEWLHFEHWLSIMQQSSSILYDALNGRAHLAEVRVLIPYKWRQFEWPVLHKPGSPIMMNRRLRFADSDVIVGFEGKYLVVNYERNNADGLARKYQQILSS